MGRRWKGGSIDGRDHFLPIWPSPGSSHPESSLSSEDVIRLETILVERPIRMICLRQNDLWLKWTRHNVLMPPRSRITHNLINFWPIHGSSYPVPLVTYIILSCSEWNSKESWHTGWVVQTNKTIPLNVVQKLSSKFTACNEIIRQKVDYETIYCYQPIFVFTNLPFHSTI